MSDKVMTDYAMTTKVPAASAGFGFSCRCETNAHGHHCR
jgi:hypothetical protein